jgi:general secretion pathway protein H
LQGTPVRWRATPHGFALEGLNKPVPEQPWLSQDTRVLDVLPRNPGIDLATLATLALGPEPVLPPQAVVLGSGQTPGNTVRVATDGVRPFAIVPAELAAPAPAGRAP